MSMTRKNVGDHALFGKPGRPQSERRVVPWASSATAALGFLMLGTMLVACQQQVANAEQPAAATSGTTSNAVKPETESSALQGAKGKGKLVFDKPACELPNRGGEVTPGCSVLARLNVERQGHLTYGPYVPLPAGEYLFELDYRSSGELAKPAGLWDAAARLGPDEQIVAKGDITGTGNEATTLVGHFSMPKKDGVAVLEIRMSPALTAETEIKRLRIYEAVAN